MRTGTGMGEAWTGTGMVEGVDGRRRNDEPMPVDRATTLLLNNLEITLRRSKRPSQVIDVLHLVCLQKNNDIKTFKINWILTFFTHPNILHAFFWR